MGDELPKISTSRTRSRFESSQIVTVFALVILIGGCSGTAPGQSVAGSTTAAASPALATTTMPATTTSLATTTTTSPATTTTVLAALSQQTFEGNVRVAVPTGWTEFPQPANTVYGDHVDRLFSSPTDPNELLLVILDHCSGCVVGVAPGALAPIGAMNTSAISATKAAFSSAKNARYLSNYWADKGSDTLASGYETNGLVSVGPLGADPSYAVVAVTLPAQLHAEATAVLNSVFFSG